MWLPSIAFAQTRLAVDGYQIRVPEANAELHCDGFKVARTMVIDSISGHHNGFWITKAGRIEKAYWSRQHSDSCIGYVLKPGFYYVYPNIVLPSDTAKITLWLKERR